MSTYQYDPYGNLTSSTGSVVNPWRFASGYFDSSTGLYKYGTRYYNPGFGRWSQQDPVRGQLNDPTSLNRYVYAGDDPVNLTDPSGTLTLTFDCLASILYEITNGLLALGGYLGFGVWIGGLIDAALLAWPIGLALIVGAALIAILYIIASDVLVWPYCHNGKHFPDY